jgi:hypothetical protein
MATEKIIVCWRDIPAQVIIKKGRARGKAELSLRFQEAIDRAAMRAGKGSSDAYMADWRRERSSFSASGDLQELARDEADKLEAAWSDERLAQLVSNKGVVPD